MYHWSDYWGTWSRVLYSSGMMTIELNITPVNAKWEPSVWEEIKKEKIRVHNTNPDHRDKFVSTLPEEVYNELVAKVGEEIARKLTTYDYMSVGVDAFARASRAHQGCGGFPFNRVTPQISRVP